jgi:uncharacterized membrane protein
MLAHPLRPAKTDFGVAASPICGAVELIYIGGRAFIHQPQVTASRADVLTAPLKHTRHHGRFYLALVLGAAVFLLTGSTPLRLAAGGDAFYGVYLVATLLQAGRGTPGMLRRRATYEDEGMILIVIITVAAIALSVTTMVSLLNGEGRPDTLTLVLAIASVPLGWLTLHTVAAFHYGHLYYVRAGHNGGGRDAAGLSFPETDEPGSWDFLYFSFVIGMTAQVSDVQVVIMPMRRLVMIHSIVSFFYNTVLLALSVNIVVALTH